MSAMASRQGLKMSTSAPAILRLCKADRQGTRRSQTDQWSKRVVRRGDVAEFHHDDRCRADHPAISASRPCLGGGPGRPTGEPADGSGLARPIPQPAAMLPTVLDIGCGIGEPMGRYLIEQGCSLTGVDSAPEMIAICESRLPRQTWRVADMRSLSLDQVFNGILAWEASSTSATTTSAGCFPSSGRMRPRAPC